MPMLVSIIIVNWNSGALLRRCLDSVATASASNGKSKTKGAGIEVIVADNSSTDHSVAQARESSQSFRLIKMPENAGFARANNVGLQDAAGDILLLLNPDTELRPGALAEIVAAFERHPRAAVVGPKLVNADGS
jgi:hypothetical protein